MDVAILCGEGGVEEVACALRALGYEFRGQFGDAASHYYAVLDRGDVRLCRAHIFTEETADWHSKLRSRDVLRRDRELAREYDEYKLALAKVAENKTEYAEVKSWWVDTFLPKVINATAVDVEAAALPATPCHKPVNQ